MSSTFGKIFRVTTFGESHGRGVGVVVDGVPPALPISLGRVADFLRRRRPGQGPLSSPRCEQDIPECLSGLENGQTLGTPLCLLIRNSDVKKGDYCSLAELYRPSHGDFTTEAKYGIRPVSGGGRVSARETVGRVAAAAVAEQVLEQLLPGLRVLAWVDSVGPLSADPVNPEMISREAIDKSHLRCPDLKIRDHMESLILEAKQSGDSLGGCIRGACLGVPAGLGEPVFDKLEADLARAMMSLPAARGFEIGSGFQAATMWGSEHNDPFEIRDGEVRTSSNHSGGIQAGISNGEPVLFRVAFKPVATIFKKQRTVSNKGDRVVFSPEQGRHDPCVLPRAVPMVESMALLVLMDHFLRQKLVLSCRQ